MSQHASELCCLLLEDTYGELTARVFSILLRNGRLQLSLIIHHTGLSSRQIKHSLAVLIQQHLVYHYRPPDGDATFYEADSRNAYALVRPGKIINLVEERYGKAACGVVSNLLLLGHARVDDLAAAYNLNTGRVDQMSHEDGPYANAKGLPNGARKAKTSNTAKASGLTLESLHTTIYTLLQAGVLAQVHPTHFRSAADNRNEAERMVLTYADFVGGPRGTKQKAAFEAAVQKQLQTWRSGDRLSTQFIGGGLSGSRKRRMESFVPSRAEKRVKLGSGPTYSLNGVADDDGIMLDDNLVLRINHEKLIVAFRNNRLVEFAEHCIGKTTSLVYAEVLRCLEAQIPRCRTDQTVPLAADDEDEPLPTFTTNELSDLLCRDLDLVGSIGRESQTKLSSSHTQHSKKGRLNGEDGEPSTANGYISIDEHDDHVPTTGTNPGFRYADTSSSALKGKDDDDDDPISDRESSMSSIKQHLHLLAEDEHEFVRLTDKDNGLVEWSVDFSALSRQLRQYELERTITARFGTLATRMVRIFLDKGKLDEKQISNLALIHQKQMRAALTVMHEAGHLELQEVPRDNNRQPSRTMFLWYFDPERCRHLVLEQTYKAMARCLQRVKVERLAIQTLIDKAERTDVVGKEDQYLSVDERVVLSRWREKEERILGEVGRLDELVGVLRDY